MKQETFSREQVISVIDELLQRPDMLIDAVKNENTDWYADSLLEFVEKHCDIVPQSPEWSERKKATFAFFDKLPDGLREMAKENYDEIASARIPRNIKESIGHGFNWPSDIWNDLFVALSCNHPSITLNGITYDLTKCYE